jgi:hypothetical protein
MLDTNCVLDCYLLLVAELNLASKMASKHLVVDFPIQEEVVTTMGVDLTTMDQHHLLLSVCV